MKLFPFKRQLIILASILAALCIAIPVATFAHGTPPGEQKRVQPAVRTQAVAGQPTNITADCSSPQLLTTLQKGDVLNVHATLSSGDSGESTEGENLFVLDGSVSPPATILFVDYSTGKGSKIFEASVNNDPIQACIFGIDSDETGTVTFTVTHIQKPIHLHALDLLDNVTTVEIDVTITPVGNNMAIVNSIKLTTTFPGARCAGFAVPSIKITSQGHVVLNIPPSKTPIILVGPGAAGIEKSAIIYKGTPPVTVALGQFTIEVVTTTDYSSIFPLDNPCASDNATSTLKV